MAPERRTCPHCGKVVTEPTGYRRHYRGDANFRQHVAACEANPANAGRETHRERRARAKRLRRRDKALRRNKGIAVEVPTGLLALSIRVLVAQLAHAVVVGGDAAIDRVIAKVRPEVLRDLDAETRRVLLQDFVDLLRD